MGSSAADSGHGRLNLLGLLAWLARTHTTRETALSASSCVCDRHSLCPTPSNSAKPILGSLLVIVKLRLLLLVIYSTC